MIQPRHYRSNAPANETDQPHSWRDQAACADADETLFYLHGNANGWETGPGREQAAEARAICATCPALLACRRDAIDMRDGDTFRGGMTPQERRLWARAQGRPSQAGKRTPAPTPKHNRPPLTAEMVEQAITDNPAATVPKLAAQFKCSNNRIYRLVPSLSADAQLHLRVNGAKAGNAPARLRDVS